MKNSNYLKFKVWLKRNKHRFTACPSISKIEIDRFIIVLKDVIDLRISFNENGIDIWAAEEFTKRKIMLTKNVNFLTQFYLDEESDKDINVLLEEHVYLPFMEWVNKYIIPDNIICFYGAEDGGIRSVDIINKSMIEVCINQKNYLWSNPVIMKAGIRDDFIYKNLKQWLKSNQHRFKVRPYVDKVKKTSFNLAFEGVEKVEINFRDASLIELFTFDKGEFVDQTFDFSIYEEKSQLGYYDFFDQDPVYYTNREKFWEELCYNGILDWANKTLNQETSLCLYKHKDNNDIERKWSKILNNSSLEKDVESKYRIYCKPIIKPK